MIEPSWLLSACIFPALVSAAVLVTVGRLAGRGKENAIGIGWAIAVALAYGIGQIATRVPTFPPATTQDRLLMVLLPAALIVAITAFSGPRAASAAWVLRIVLAAGTPLLLLQSVLKFPNFWSVQATVMWLVGPAIGIAILLSLLRLLDRKDADRTIPFLIFMVAAASGITISYSGSIIVGKLSLSLSAVMAGGFVASFLLPQKRAGVGCTGVAAVVLVGLLLYGRHYAELKSWHAIVLALSPLLAWGGQLPAIRKSRKWQRGLITTALVAIPLAVVVASAYWQFKQSDGGY